MRLLDETRQDAHHAFRALAAAPTFAAVATGTLAVGIGAAVALFTVFSAVLLRPLPIADPPRLVVIDAEDVRSHASVGASWTRYEFIERESTVFSGAAAYVARELTVSGGDVPAQVLGLRVTAGFFGVLGVVPARGRDFRRDEDVENAAPVAIATDAFWRQHLGGDPGVVGRAVRVDGRPTVIVGVLAPGFRFEFADREPQLYLTSVTTPAVLTAAQIRTGAGFLGYVARLKATATIDAVRAELAALDARYRREYGGYSDAANYVLRATPFVESLVGDVRWPLVALMAAVGLVLLISCVNVAHLLLGRATAREREHAVRLALGASRARLVRQALVESLMLAMFGGGLGTLAATWLVALFVSFGPTNIPRLRDASIDAGVLVFALAAACATAVLFGVFPVLVRGEPRLGEALGGGRLRGPSARAARLHEWLAGSEVAVTVALAVAASLLVESFIRVRAVDLGFDAAHVSVARIALPRGRYAEPYRRAAFFTQLLAGLEAAPGRDVVGATSYLPMGGSNYAFFAHVDGQPSGGRAETQVIAVRHVSRNYFRAMRIAIRRGRAFLDTDVATSQPVAIISEAAARRYFPGVDPIGRHIASTGDEVMREIVGVVGDVRFDGPIREVREELYLPYRQVPWPAMSIVVSSQLPMDAVAERVRREVARLDPDLAVAEIRPMEGIVAASMTEQRFTSMIFGGFAALATVLASVGIYGVLALFVSQRRHEFGVRMALGAQTTDVLGLVMREGAKVIAAGMLAGVVGAAVASRLLASLLYSVAAAQPAAYAVGAATQAAIGLLACYIAARRATSVNPAQTLRAD